MDQHDPAHDVTTSGEFVAILGDPRRMRILEILTGHQASVKGLAEQIGETPQVAHYHTKRLESAGLIKIVATREARGTPAKFHRAVADRFVLRQAVGGEGKEGVAAGLQWAAEWLHLGEQHLSDDGPSVGLAGVQVAETDGASLATFAQRLVQVEQDFRDCEKPGTGERYVMVTAVFPFPPGKAAPEDPTAFLEMAFETEGTDLRFA